MSDDDKFITVPVRVPADLEVVRESPTVRWMHVPGDKAHALFYYNPQDTHWVAVVGQQIAAAIEARKPKPTKFGVGDVVEWEGGAGKVRHTEVLPNGKEAVWLNDRGASFLADALTLVRRAEK